MAEYDEVYAGGQIRSASPFADAKRQGSVGVMLIHPDRLFPAEPGTRKIARKLYERVRNMPIVSPHGHTHAAWFARNEPFPDPARLLVQPDHYIFRMLYSQGVRLRIWRLGEQN